MNDCIFCKIIEGELESKKVYEDEKVLVILDAYGKSKGHSLIIPKKHSENILEEDIDLLLYIKKTIEILKEDYKASDYKVVTNIGKKAGQEIFHTHVHVIPYY